MTPRPNYAHKATFISGHDGDSFWLSVDFGANMHGVKLVLPMYVRLYGIDTWEINQALGVEARDFTNNLLQTKAIVVQTIKPDNESVGLEKYGRFLARVFVGQDELSDLLRAAGYEKKVS
jgi:endonuclease YncB( thermonuclease family)